jgi:hypothetical protein
LVIVGKELREPAKLVIIERQLRLGRAYVDLLARVRPPVAA